jgi:hypothetical protein
MDGEASGPEGDIVEHDVVSIALLNTATSSPTAGTDGSRITTVGWFGRTSRLLLMIK